MKLVLAQSKFDKRARSEFACQFACQFACPEPAAVWSQIKAFSRPNLRAKLVLQAYGQKRLDRKTTTLKNLTPPKFDSAAVSSSQHRARRRDSIGKQIWKARNIKPIISL